MSHFVSFLPATSLTADDDAEEDEDDDVLDYADQNITGDRRMFPLYALQGKGSRYEYRHRRAGRQMGGH